MESDFTSKELVVEVVKNPFFIAKRLIHSPKNLMLLWKSTVRGQDVNDKQRQIGEKEES